MYSNELVCNILKYIEKNLSNEITISNISNYFSYDKTYIMKKFKKELKVTIKEYINIKKILNSLNDYNENKSILTIALKNNYNSLEYYSETFSHLVGVSPRTYKKFITPLNNLTDEEITKIRLNISNLLEIEGKIQTYLSHQKPQKLPVRKLSIFN